MKTDLRQARTHQILRAERMGDTLIVTPLGDRMEFSNGTFEQELACLRRIATDEAIKNIVCDFAEKDYFSQELVVPLLGLRDKIRTRGRLVTAGMSTQMAKLFEHSASGTHFMNFPSRSLATAEVADMSFREAISAKYRQHGRFLKPILGVLLVAAVLSAWKYLGDPVLNGSAANKLYTTMEKAWADAEKTASSNPKKSNWSGLSIRMSESLLDEIVAIREQETKTAAEAAVLEAANSLLAIAARPQAGLELSQERFLASAEAARTAIEEEDSVKLDPFQRIAMPGDE